MGGGHHPRWAVPLARPARGQPDSAAPWPATLAATYRAIAARTGARVIVDSSKFASDAALLPRTGITPAYVHLIRDPRAADLIKTGG